MSKTPDYQDVISFWFEETKTKQWFAKDVLFDETIRMRFSEIHAKAVKGELSKWRRFGALGRLAEITVLDQFSRNLYRNDARQFVADTVALVLAQEAVRGDFDQRLTKEQRAFLYLPFMHSESAHIHKKALKLYTALGLKQNLEFEEKHKAIIDRFGRFPHRNEVLGRTSTEEELEFLKLPDSHF